MAAPVDTPLAREIRRLLSEKGVTPKRASIGAGLGETYVRDLITAGRSGGPQLKKLGALERFLGVSEGYLTSLAGAPAEAQVIKDADELVLLRAWRKLEDDDHKMVLDFIEFRLATAGRGEAA